MKLRRGSRDRAVPKSGRRTSDSADREVGEVVQSAVERLLRLAACLSPTASQRRLGYEDAIGWFVDNRPENTARRGALLRTEMPDGRTEIVQVFLDADNQMVQAADGGLLGRRIVVYELDDELAETFGNARLVIVE
jgi:hypothetical protein